MTSIIHTRPFRSRMSFKRNLMQIFFKKKRGSPQKFFTRPERSGMDSKEKPPKK